MLSSLNFFEHTPFILLVLYIICQDQSLSFLALLLFPFLGLNLIGIQEVSFSCLLFRVNEPNSNLLFKKPFICPLKVVLLVRLVLRIDYLSKHVLEAAKQSLAVTEIDSEACLHLNLLGRRAVLAVSFGLNEELDQPGLEPFENRIAFKWRTPQGLLFKFETLHCLGLCTHFVKVSVAIVQVRINLVLALTIWALTLLDKN